MSSDMDCGTAENNGFSSEPKIMWFEFLLQPKLLETHLKNVNSSPQPFELIAQFLTNALTISTTSVTSVTNPSQVSNGTEEQNGFNPSVVSPSIDSIKKAMDNKKSNAIRFLSFKIMSYLKWDLSQLETNLPPTQQDFLLNELIRYCDVTDGPTTCKLFAHILYYRWILRYIMKSNYPTRPSKGPLIPITLQQQIDPCFVSNEALDSLMKKLQEQCPTAVSDLEKVVIQKQKGNRVEVWMPSFECFGEDFVCDWDKSDRINITDVLDDIMYDIGRWFFFREDYSKSNLYFESISLSKRNTYNNLNGYLITTREMISNQTNKDKDIEIIDFDKQVIDSIERLVNGQTSDLSSLDSLSDVKELKKIIENIYKKYDDKNKRNRIFRITKYLSNRVKGLNEELSKSNLFKKSNKIPEVVIDDNDVEMIEEGEIDVDEEPLTRDPELLLLESTDPEVIQSLVGKTQKHPLMINNRWTLPIHQSSHLKNLHQIQYDKCHLILAKANELRSANLFFEARVLFLSLLEDVQATLPLLADVIRWELLRTDLEIRFETSDVDERQTTDLITKCNRTLLTVDKAFAEDFSDLIELSCIFLLEQCPESLKDFSVSCFPILKFSGCLSWIKQDFASNTSSNKAKELWEMLIQHFMYPNVMKKGQSPLPVLTFSNSFVSFVSKFKDMNLIKIIISCLSKIHNTVRDNSSQELTIISPYSSLWSFPIIQSMISNIDLDSVSSALNKLLDEFLDQKPNELYLLKLKAELSLIDSLYADAMKYFILILIIKTKYFTSFSNSYSEEDSIIHRMIQCCVRLSCHTQAALLHQLTREPNYGLAFKALSERNCNDSCDDLYECIWDTTLLEFLINLHHRRGETERKTKAIQLMGQLELNANNSEPVLKEAADLRRGRLLRIFARIYL